jgi:phosphoribosylformylglycinamidine synthase
MAGLIEEIDKIVDPAFKDGGDAIIVVGETFDEFGGSVYLEYVKSDEVPDIPELDLDKEKKTQKTMLRLIREGLVKSAHDISDGGLIAALLESAIFGGKGAKIDLNTVESPHILLFSESQSRFLITVKPENTEKIIKNFSGVNIIAEEIGRVGGDAVIIKNNNKIIAELSLTEVKDKYENYLPEIMNQ